MKHLFKHLALLLGYMLITISLFSCSDDEMSEKSMLYGTWENQAYIYTFNSNGYGYFQYSPYNGGYDAVGDIKSHFSWTASENILSINYDGSGTVYSGTQTLYYKVDGNLLLLIDIESGDTNSFTKQ